MRELKTDEINVVSAGKFKFHFNVFQAVFNLFSGALLGGPVGVGIAIGSLIATQGLSQLHDITVEHFGLDPIQ